MKRRQFLKLSAGATAGVLLSGKKLFAFQQSPKVRKFLLECPDFEIPAIPGITAGSGVNTLRGDIPAATPDTTTFPGEHFYQIEEGEYRHVFHPDLVDPVKNPGCNPLGAKLWGYRDINPANPKAHTYLGNHIVAIQAYHPVYAPAGIGAPVRIRFKNNLVDPATGADLLHPVPVDSTMMQQIAGYPDLGLENRTAVHLHGGFIPWESDGGPHAWFAPNGIDPATGLRTIPRWGVEYLGHDHFYSNTQRATFLWYHDHAYGLTRINAYAGLASGYVLADLDEVGLITSGQIPPLERTKFFVLQDKSFVPPTGNDPNGRGQPGDIWYPSVYEPLPLGRWATGAGFPPPATTASIVPEAFLDQTVINGKCFPYVNVEPRRYRFRFLNGNQARFYNLQLYYAKYSANGIAGQEADVTKPGPNMIQIGTEGGFLPNAVMLTQKQLQLITDQNGNPFPVRYTLLLGCAERADVIIDFRNVPVGSRLILYNDAPAPFPGGDPLNDYFWGSVAQPASGPLGFGPNTRTLMQIRVVGLNTLPGHNVLPDTVPIGFLPVLPAVPKLSPVGANVRWLTLNEDFDQYGRLRQTIGTNQVTGIDPLTGAGTFVKHYENPATEIVNQGAVEVWKIINTTADVHPIHFHLLNFQIISRQKFNLGAFGVGAAVGSFCLPTFISPARGPDPNERGWKETIRMYPGEVITLIGKFDLPPGPGGTLVPGANHAMYGYAGPSVPGGVQYHNYVYHCHILEHEEHDMMRMLQVLA